MEVLDLTTQQQICIPAQCFIDPVYGTAVVADTIDVQVSTIDLCTGLATTVSTTVALLGDAVVTRNAEYYGLRFDSLAASPAGYPGHVGPMRPGRRYAMKFHSTTAVFGDFNLGPFGVTDNRLDVITTAIPLWTIANRGLQGVWTKNGWTWARKYIGDGRAAGPVYVANPSTYEPVIAVTSWEYQNGDPDAIHYDPLIACYTAFDGYRLYTNGVNGVIDGTPWNEAGAVNAKVQLLDHGANLAQVPVYIDGSMVAPLSKATVSSWWVLQHEFAGGSESLRAAYRSPRQVSARLYLNEAPTVFSTCDSMQITQDLAGFQLLPYRYRIFNGKLMQEFGAMNAPDAWWSDFSSDPLDSYTVGHRECVAAAGGDPAEFWSVDYFHPTAFTYGELVLK